MSSTTNIQNLLVNVFRPVYRYEVPSGQSNSIFVPKIEVSNIDNYSGNTISVFTAAVGDSANNVYVGSNAGNPYTTVRACSNVTAVGAFAGSNISNVSNTVYLGFNAGTGAIGASSVVAVGANARGEGVSNVYVGANTGSAGSSNIYIGTSNTGTGSNNILIGQGIVDGGSSSLFRLGTGYLYGDLNTKWLGIGTSTSNDPNNKLDVSGNVYVFGQQGINMVPIRTLDVNGNFRASDSNGTLDFNGGVATVTGGFASVRGTTTVSGGATTIGTLRRGTVLVSAVSTTTSSKHAARHLLAYTTSNTDDLASNVSGGSVSITLSTSNIQISDAANGTYDWSITYFPLP